MLNSQWTARWNTKGYPEISKKLRKLSHKLGFEYIEAIGIDFETCQNLKRQSDIVIGDIVTGSYHLTELEALAQGKVVLSFLDNQTQMTLQNLTGCTDIPIVNTYIDELEPILEYLIKHKDVCSQLGTLSRKWIEQYYDDKKLIQILVDLYKKLLNGEKIERENSKEYQEAKDFLHRKVYDIKWQVRKEKSFKLRHQLLYNVLRLGFKAISAVCPKSKKEFFKEKSRRYRITNY